MKGFCSVKIVAVQFVLIMETTFHENLLKAVKFFGWLSPSRSDYQYDASHERELTLERRDLGSS